MVLQSKLIAPVQQIANGTSFWEIYEGRTRTGWGQVSIIWEVVINTGGKLYSCRQLSNNTCKVNPDYREIFTESDIKRIMAETPILDYSSTI